VRVELSPTVAPRPPRPPPAWPWEPQRRRWHAMVMEGQILTRAPPPWMATRRRMQILMRLRLPGPRRLACRREAGGGPAVAPHSPLLVPLSLLRVCSLGLRLRGVSWSPAGSPRSYSDAGLPCCHWLLEESSVRVTCGAGGGSRVTGCVWFVVLRPGALAVSTGLNSDHDLPCLHCVVPASGLAGP